MEYIIYIENTKSAFNRDLYAKDTWINDYKTFRPVADPAEATIFSSLNEAKARARELNRKNGFSLLRFSVIALDTY